MGNKLTNEYVKESFESEGYRLLCDYINSRVKLKYVCPNGHPHSISWANWQRGRRCSYCSNKVKKTIGFIKLEFKKDGYTLLTKKYKNNHQKLDYICPKGHKHNISWGNWQRGHRCPYCDGQGKHNIEFIKKEFRKENYVILTKEYKNNREKLNYICPKSHRHNISWGSWQQGVRCPLCYYERMSVDRAGKNGYMYGKCGPLSPAWKGGISCEPYCQEWSFKEFKDMIKERDGYKCLNPDCFGNIYRLNVHHIDYDKKNCVPENLITLCVSCNSRANGNREWHESWYKAIINRRCKTLHV